MARERYLVGAGEDTIHTGVIELKTGKEKRKNWWHYHKVQVFVALLLIAVAASWIYTVVTKVEPDYSVGMITSFQMPAEVTEALEEYLSPYCDDRNGDGKIQVQVNNYVFGDSSTIQDYQMLQASYARFAGNASVGLEMIYIHDVEGLDALGDAAAGFFLYNDGTPMPDEAADFDNASRPWAEFQGLSDFTADGNELNNWTPEVVQELCKRLLISVRTTDGAVRTDEEMGAYHADSLRLLDRLETGEKLR